MKKVHVKNVHGALLDDKPYAKPYKNSPKKARLDLKDMINGNSNSLVVLQENGSLNNSLIPTNNEPKKIFSCSICKEKFSSRTVIIHFWLRINRLDPWPWVFPKYIHDWSLFEGVKSLDTVAVFMAMQNPSNANIVMQVSHESALWMPIWRNISTLHYNLASIPVFSCISTMKITVTWHSNGSSTIVFVCTYKLILSASKVLKHKSDYSAS